MGFKVLPPLRLGREAIEVVTISEEHRELIAENAGKALLGFPSRFRGREDRREAQRLDARLGQLGEASLSLYLTGRIDAYKQHREECNANPLKGDGGRDLPGRDVDVKTSLMRGSPDPLAYTLVVRPSELHLGFAYVLALVEHPSAWSTMLVGWAWAQELELEEDEDSPFCGAFVRASKELRAMEDLRDGGELSGDS